MNGRTHVDLFSGLGGFSLAAAANGVRTVQFCEIDQRCRDFLARTFPGVPIHDDVRTLGLADAASGRQRDDGGAPGSAGHADERDKDDWRSLLPRGRRQFGERNIGNPVYFEDVCMADAECNGRRGSHQERRSAGT
ncbi:hypothetical protein FJ251_15535, partial [bacterium]|nr:hypothetical protein [bacterium]